MKIEGISMVCETEAEALDAMEEMRYLVELADDGGIDLGPAFRSLLRSAYWATEGVANAAAPDSTSS
jgi:hypothetical protein